MTTQKTLKRRVRARAAKTGESYTAARSQLLNKAGAPVAAADSNAPAEPAAEEVSYRDLQAKAKALDIPANQSREELESALAEADSDE